MIMKKTILGQLKSRISLHSSTDVAPIKFFSFNDLITIIHFFYQFLYLFSLTNDLNFIFLNNGMII